MAASGLPKSGSGPIRPLSKPPSRNQSFQRTPSRRVYFSEVDTENQTHREMPPKQEVYWESTDDKKESRGFRLCCAWSCLIGGSVVLVLLLLGVLLMSFLQGALPEFRIMSLTINKLDVVTKDQTTLLTSDVQVVINATNNNGRYELSYGALTVDVSSQNVALGMGDVEPFKQEAHKMSELRIKAAVKKAAVDGDAANGLEWNFKQKQVPIDVAVKGKISIKFKEGRELNELPLVVLCSNLDQNEIDRGNQPKCRVRMFTFL